MSSTVLAVLAGPQSAAPQIVAMASAPVAVEQPAALPITTASGVTLSAPMPAAYAPLASPSVAVLDLSTALIDLPSAGPGTGAPLDLTLAATAVVQEIANPVAAPPVTPQNGAAQSSDIVVTARDRGYAPDPIRALNAESFAATQSVDRALVGPAALAYKSTIPRPVRDGVRNFLYNLREPVVFVNFVLQLKIGKAAETVARFAVNSVVGVAGVFDIAKRRPFKLPRRSNGFANTLGFYGVSPGPFMFLPLVGPTTVRDLLGGAIDRLVVPLALGSTVTKPEFAIPAAVLGALDHRAEFDETLQTLHQNAADPYANSRDFYLQRRQAEIDQLRGRTTGVGPMSAPPSTPIILKGRTLTPGGAAPQK